MRNRASVALTLVILALWAGNGLCIIEKMTISVPASRARCFGQIFGDQASYKLKYTTLDEGESQTEDKTAKKKVKGGVEVSLVNPITNAVIFKSDSNHNVTSLFLKDGAILYQICITNKLEDPKKVNLEISSGLDINDFANLPLQVVSSNPE